MTTASSVGVYEPGPDDSVAPIETVELPDGKHRQVVQVLSGLVPEHSDDVELGYNAAGKLETVLYRYQDDVVGQLLLTYYPSGKLQRARRVS